MKIREVTCWLLRIPFTFPLVKKQQHAFANCIEIETDDVRNADIRVTDRG